MPFKLPAFDGIDANATAWAKHYLSPGTDVSKEWTGIPDGVSGDTFKYGNQFDFAFSYTDNIAYSYGLNCSTTTGNKTVFMEPYSNVLNPVANLTDLTLWRLPLPDLPAILLFHSTIGWNFNGKTWYWLGMPIFDPNWAPTCAVLGNADQATIFCGSYTQNTVVYPIGTTNFELPVTPGYANNLTGYRMAGASVTIMNTASNMYKNGTIVACSADTPLCRPFINSTTYSPFSDNHVLENMSYLLSVSDAPISYEQISSIKNYHKFEMKEGCYVVLHNLQGDFLFRNPEMDTVPPLYNLTNSTAVAFCCFNTDNKTATPCIVCVNGANPIYIPLIYNQTQHSERYYLDNDNSHVHLEVPFPFIDPSSLSYWNSGYISFRSTDLANSLTYTFKFNTFAECYVASDSSLKTNVTKSCRYYPSIIDYTADFYSAYDGIYTAADNDSGQVWNTFKRAVGKAVDTAIQTSPYGPLFAAGKALIKDAFDHGGASKNTNRSVSPSARRFRFHSAPMGLRRQKFQPDVNDKAQKKLTKQVNSKKMRGPYRRPNNKPKGPAPVSYEDSVPTGGVAFYNNKTWHLADPGERAAYIQSLRDKNKADRQKKKANKKTRRDQTVYNNYRPRNRAGTAFRGRGRGRGRGRRY